MQQNLVAARLSVRAFNTIFLCFRLELNSRIMFESLCIISFIAKVGFTPVFSCVVQATMCYFCLCLSVYHYTLAFEPDLLMEQRST